jgi:hypothetical protein
VSLKSRGRVLGPFEFASFEYFGVGDFFCHCEKFLLSSDLFYFIFILFFN